MAKRSTRRICFVTGTRAEFGLMRSTLRAICEHPALRLQIVATGMHLDRSRGYSIDTIRREGWAVDRAVPWPAVLSRTQVGTARGTGAAMAGIAAALDELRSDVVLVVGDRVEAFAAAAAGHLSGRVVAHVHGGDRAAGQADDSLRHAVTKLAHVHFPATKQSAARVLWLGEDRWRVRRVGSPGVDGGAEAAAPWADVLREMPQLAKRDYALLVLHPAGADERAERRRAEEVLGAVRRCGVGRVVIVYPNNDPGSGGIVRCWEGVERAGGVYVRRDVPRPLFLALMRDAAVLVGNSSSGIIEAATFRTPVVDIGPRQAGRERGGNVVHVPRYDRHAIGRALERVRARAGPRRAWPRAEGGNVYGTGGAGRRIADALAGLEINDRLLRKLIAY